MKKNIQILRPAEITTLNFLLRVYVLLTTLVNLSTSQNFLTGPDLCQQKREPNSGLCYYSEVDSYWTYKNAREFCQDQGGELPRVQSQYTMDFIREYAEIFNLPVLRDVWLGLKDEGSNSIYSWWNGSHLGSYDLWPPNYPIGVGMCTLYHPSTTGTGTWETVSCDDTNSVICEFATTDCNRLKTYNQTHNDKGLNAVSTTGGNFADVWEFSCEDGYGRESGIWWWECVNTASNPLNLYQPNHTYLPVCKANTCDMTITNGTVVSDETQATIVVGESGEDVVVTCETGFNISITDSPITVMCQLNNVWTNGPLCNPYPCNESLVVPTANLTIGPIVTYESGQDVRSLLMCDDGFILTLVAGMPYQMICDVDGNWVNQPTCEPNTCSSVVVDHGTVTLGVAGQYTTGTSFTVTCDPGYGLVIDPDVTDTLICDTTGMWTQVTDISCTPFNCAAASITVENAKQTTFPRGLYVTGMVPEVTCEDGHYLTPDPPEAAMCVSEGASWTNKPECRPHACSTLSFPNGEATPNTAGLQTSTLVRVSCDVGYSLDATTDVVKIICRAGGVWTNPPSCTANPCVAEPVSYIESIVFPTDAHQTGATPEVTCEQGFQLDTATLTSALCDESGTLLNPPTCVPNSCNELIIPNGTLTPRTGVSSNDEVSVMCDSVYFYPFEGMLQVKCDINGTLLNPLACMGYPCTTILVLNAKTVVFDSNIPRSGSPITVQCNEGYTLHPGEVLPPECFSNGTWYNKPRCIPNNCTGNSWNIVNGVPGSVTFPGSPVSSGMTPSITCLPGYRVTPRPAVCLLDGTWSNPPVCSTGDCDPIVISHGRADKNIYMYGELATISCDKEYHAVGGNGDGTMSCDTDGRWRLQITCEPNECSASSLLIPNSAGTTFSATPVISGSTVTVVCDQAHVLSPSPPEVIVCLADGTWENKPVCQRGQCQMLRITDGFVTYDGGYYGDVATITCQLPYHIDNNLTSGTGTSTCSSNLQWTPTHTCNVNSCEDLVLENGAVDPSFGRTTDEAVDITCDEGFVPDGFTAGQKFEVDCGKDNRWLNKPACVPTNEGSGSGTEPGSGSGTTQPANACDPHGIANVETLPPQPVPNSLTTFICNDGYTLEGSVTARCNEDQSWTGVDLPLCQENNCTNLAITRGTVPVPRLQTGNDVTVTCETGYSPDSNQPFTALCDDNGEWTNKPLCQTNECTSVAIANGQVSNGEVRTGDEVQITCDADRVLVPPQTSPVVCSNTGTWLQKPACLSCSQCLENHNTYNYPGNLDVFDDKVPDAATIETVCSAYLGFVSCWETLGCTNLPTDAEWKRKRNLLTWVCDEQNKQGIESYKSCLEDGLASASANVISTCNENLQEITAGNNAMCSAGTAYFNCLAGPAGSKCSDQNAASDWFIGYTNNINQVSPAKCAPDSGTAGSRLSMATVILSTLIGHHGLLLF